MTLIAGCGGHVSRDGHVELAERACTGEGARCAGGLAQRLRIRLRLETREGLAPREAAVEEHRHRGVRVGDVRRPEDQRHVPRGVGRQEPFEVPAQLDAAKQLAVLCACSSFSVLLKCL